MKGYIMQIQFYTNLNFNGNDIKIALRVVGHYFFCVYFNGQDYNLQTYYDNNIDKNYENIIKGSFCNLQELYDSWQKISEEKANNLLMSSYKLFLGMDKYNLSIFTNDEKKFIINTAEIYYNYIAQFVTFGKNKKVIIKPEHRYIIDNDKVKDNNDNWIPFNANDYTNEYIQNIIMKLRNNNGNFIEHDNKKFRFVNGTLQFQQIINDSVNPAPAIQKQKIRKYITMFKIINANNLNSLFTGNFYPVIKQDGDYCIIKDDNGNKCTIRSNRGRIINVYQDKPE